MWPARCCPIGHGHVRSPDTALLEKELTGKIIGVFYEVYNEIGPGFPEFVYRRAMAIALALAGLSVVAEAHLPIWFRGHRIVKFQADLVVEDRVIVEVKSSADVNEFHNIQLTNYLRATDIEVGLLLNFGKRAEFKRRVLQNSQKRRPGPNTSTDAGPPTASCATHDDRF
jgi:GxxExxY protein